MLFLTGNENKVKEARELLNTNNIESMKCDLIEIQSISVEEVSIEKVKQASKYIKSNTPFFIEDTGLFIDKANGFPGALIKFMYDSIGCDGICKFAEGSTGYALTIIAYSDENGKIHLFKGKKRGHFSLKPKGNTGFGWDPVFIPRIKKNQLGTKTFAELSADEKNKVSQRMKAFKKFKKFLSKN